MAGTSCGGPGFTGGVGTGVGGGGVTGGGVGCAGGRGSAGCCGGNGVLVQAAKESAMTVSGTSRLLRVNDMRGSYVDSDIGSGGGVFHLRLHRLVDDVLGRQTESGSAQRTAGRRGAIGAANNVANHVNRRDRKSTRLN